MKAPVTVADFINYHDANQLIRLVYARDKAKTVHSVVMNWFASADGQKTLANFEKGGYIPAYAGYLLEYYLKLK